LQQRLALKRFSRSGLLLVQNGTVQLSDKGKRQALQLLKGHRMWETFLSEKVGLPADHTHEPANEMEHYISDELMGKLEQEIGDIQRDPQGRKIP
jgi:Mn-dependent DtxR family transcriptional regulator